MSDIAKRITSSEDGQRKGPLPYEPNPVVLEATAKWLGEGADEVKARFGAPPEDGASDLSVEAADCQVAEPSQSVTLDQARDQADFGECEPAGDLADIHLEARGMPVATSLDVEEAGSAADEGYKGLEERSGTTPSEEPDTPGVAGQADEPSGTDLPNLVLDTGESETMVSHEEAPGQAAPFDIESLEAGAATVVDQTAEKPHLTIASSEEIDTLTSQAREEPEPAIEAGMSDAEVEALLTQVQDAEPVLMEPSGEPPSDGQGDDSDVMSLEEIQALVFESEKLGLTEPDKSDKPEDVQILGKDDIHEMLELGARKSAPNTGKEEEGPAVDLSIPMIAEDDQFGAFTADTEPISADAPGQPSVSEIPDWSPEVVAKVPMALAIGALALPLRWEDGKLVCMVADPLDFEAIGRLSSGLRCMVDPRPAPIAKVVAALREAYSTADATSARLAMDSVSRSRPAVLTHLHNLWKKIA